MDCTEWDSRLYEQRGIYLFLHKDRVSFTESSPALPGFFYLLCLAQRKTLTPKMRTTKMIFHACMHCERNIYTKENS